MKYGLPLVAATLNLILVGSVSVAAQQDEHISHMMSGTPDTRQILDFPPPMRQHMLSMMRGHLDALSEILTALSVGDAAKAGAIAESRLGLQSSGAAACNPKESRISSSRDEMSVGDMPAMMAQYMPDGMRALGYAMHESASNFALETARMLPGDDPKPALASLSRMTQSCAACHNSYRLK
jgi:hypothetical protein